MNPRGFLLATATTDADDAPKPLPTTAPSRLPINASYTANHLSHSTQTRACRPHSKASSQPGQLKMGLLPYTDAAATDAADTDAADTKTPLPRLKPNRFPRTASYTLLPA